MSTLANRALIGLGLIGSVTMLVVLFMQVPAIRDQVMTVSGPTVSYELLPLLRFALALFACTVSILASAFAFASVDSTGITYEGRVTTLAPLILAGCGLALTVRWMPAQLGFAIAWLALHVPGAVVGLILPKSTAEQIQRRQQSAADEKIGVQWELKQLANRVALLQQLTQPGGPNYQAQKKLATTGNSLEKYYADTLKQLDVFLQQVDDQDHRATALNMQQTLQNMHVGK